MDFFKCQYLKHIHRASKWYHIICLTHYIVQAESTYANAAGKHAFYRSALEEHSTISIAVKQQKLSAKRKLLRAYYFSQEPGGTSNKRLTFCVRKKKHDSSEKKSRKTRRSERINIQINLSHIYSTVELRNSLCQIEKFRSISKALCSWSLWYSF